MIISLKQFIMFKEKSPVSFTDQYFVPFKGTSGPCVMALDHNPMNSDEALAYAKKTLADLEKKPVAAENTVFKTEGASEEPQ